MSESTAVIDRHTNRHAWLERRREGIGASEIAAVVGLCDFGRTPLDIYLSKKGIVPSIETDAMYWGHVHEPNIAARYAEVTGWTVDRNMTDIYRHPKYSWCASTPDAMVWIDTDIVLPSHNLECKSSSRTEGWGTVGTDEVPRGYLLQAQWQMLACHAMTGVTRTDIAVLLLGNDFRIYTVEANPPLQEMLLDEGEKFWWHVENDKPPEIDPSHERAAKLLGMLYKPVEGTAIELGENVLAEVEVYQELGTQISDMQKSRDAIKAVLLQKLTTHQEGLLPDGRRVKHSHVTVKEHTVAEHTQSRINILKARKA